MVASHAAAGARQRLVSPSLVSAWTMARAPWRTSEVSESIAAFKVSMPKKEGSSVGPAPRPAMLALLRCTHGEGDDVLCLHRWHRAYKWDGTANSAHRLPNQRCRSQASKRAAATVTLGVLVRRGDRPQGARRARWSEKDLVLWDVASASTCPRHECAARPWPPSPLGHRPAVRPVERRGGHVRLLLRIG